MSELVNKKVIDKEIGPLTVLFGVDNGKYPQGNSLLVKGTNQSVLIDPSLGVVERRDNLPQVDLIMLSHVHEDHVAGVHLFPDAPCICHEADALGMRDLSGMMQIYGFEGGYQEEFEQTVLNEFHYQPRPDVKTFEDGHIIDLGGVTITVLHTPGHTRGHSCFHIQWEQGGLVYLGDIELTGFGPYYGDAWSNLQDFEASIELLTLVDCELWLTFHHKGLIETRNEFLTMLEAFRAMIDFREANLLEYIQKPRSMDEIVEHRFVYRPGTGGEMVNQIERRSMAMHLDRLIASRQVRKIDNKFEVVQ